MWLELIIEVGDAAKEPVTAVLYEEGCLGTSEDGGPLTAYFEAGADADRVVALLAGFRARVTRRIVQDQDWYAGWKEGIVPFRTAGFVIRPPWKGYEAGPGEKVITLDPGQAFGTGDHPTTNAMLKMLTEWTAGKPDTCGMRFLDLGTGTGILSIAAALLGVKDITAADVEDAAIETAGKNFAHNGLGDRVRLVKGSMEDAGTGYGFVAANIFLEPLLEIVPKVPGILNPGGRLAVSGLLSGQEGRVIEAAASAGLSVVRVLPDSGWVSILLV